MPADSDPLRKRRAVVRAHREAVAFRAVLGTEGNRSSDQQIVMDALARMCYIAKPVFVGRPDTNAQGDVVGFTFDPLRAALTDGKRQVYLTLTEILQAPFQLPPEPPETKEQP